jgi:hypothetical protein
MVDDVNMKSIIDHLSAPQFKTTLAWFHGQCDKNIGRWIRSTTTRNKALALSNSIHSVYLNSLRTRSLFVAIPISVSADVYTYCRCCKSKKLKDGFDNYHCFSCAGYNGPKKAADKRHDHTRDELKQVLDCVYPTATHKVTKEKYMPTHLKPGETALKADILVEPRNPEQSHIIIDVMHTNAASDSKVFDDKTDLYPLHGATMGENGKQSKYERHYDEAYAKLLVSFMLEASGAFGHSAKKFLNNLFNVPGVSKSA